MKKFIVFYIIFIMLCASICFASIDVPDTIRIGIYATTNSVSSFTISSPSGMEVGLVDNNGDFESMEEFGEGKQITIKRGSKTNSVYVEGIGEIGDGSHFVRIIPNDSTDIPQLKVNGNRYRGEIEVRRYSGSDLTVINEVTMQEYLYGVVPREIGGNSPTEAVKAQAIIARTFAAKNYNRRIEYGFHLTNTVSDQAYGGLDWENKNSNRAVDETEGMVATYQGELIGGYYFSTSGGYTESSVNVWGGEFDYLEAVPDPYEPTNLEKTTWTVKYSASDIENKLRAKGINIGKVINMYVTEFSDAGRALELKIIGTNGIQTYTKSNIRTFLDLNSQWFTINDEAPEIPHLDQIAQADEPEEVDDVLVEEDDTLFQEDEEDDVVVDDMEQEEELKEEDASQNEELEDSKEEETEDSSTIVYKPLITEMIAKIKGFRQNTDMIFAKAEEKAGYLENVETIQIAYAASQEQVSSFEIHGRGWGHSVGMSQNGAIGMARNDFSAEEIIKWYYRGVEIEG